MENIGNFSIYKKNNLIIIKSNKSLHVIQHCLEINTLDLTTSMLEGKQKLGTKITDCIGIIGIITLEDDTYLIIITDAKLVCTINKKEIYKVLDTSFIKFTDDILSEDELFNSDEKKENNDNYNYYFNNNHDNEIIKELKDIFKRGYYFSNNYDLANSITSQKQIQHYFTKSKKLISDYDYITDGNKNFLSNLKLTDKVMSLTEKNKIKYYFSSCIYGNIEEFYYERQNIHIILISRRHLWNYGMYNYRRGLSKYGGNSNQIETELILIHNNKEIYSNIHLSSYIPIYFKSKKNIDMNDANKAFIKYFKTLTDEYNILFLCVLKNKDEQDKYINKFKSMLLKNLKSMSNKWKYYYINNKEKTIKNILEKTNKKQSILEYIGFNLYNGKLVFDNNILQMGIISLLGIDDKNLNQNELILVYQTIWEILSYISKRDKTENFLDKNIDIKLYGDEDKNIKETGNNSNEESLLFIKQLKEIFKKRAEELYNQYYTNLEDEASKKYQRVYEILFGKNMKFSPLQKNLNYLREEFSDLENIKIYVGTWNTASTDSSRIKNINLDSWLLPKDPDLVPDIYFIGFQEVVELNATNVIMITGEKQQQILDEWDKKINESIQKVGKYNKLVEMNLVGINFYFYILEDKMEKVSNISKKLVKTGLGGTTGNKGSCCINFEYENTSLSIACSHLAAGNKNKQRLKELDFILNLKLNTFYNPEIYEDKRDEDMVNQSLEEIMPFEEENKIKKTMTFNINMNMNKGTGDITNSINTNINNDSTLFKDSDIWILFGDLNFRVDMEYEEFSQYLKKGSSWNKLLDFDQFNKFKLASIDSMESIEEDEIKFPPTYKYIIDSNEFDYTPENVGSSNANQNENLKKSGKKRNPSWCDRIFYKKNAYVTKDGRKVINGVEYNNVMDENFQSSDHRPIYQIFDVIIFKENGQKKDVIEKEIISNEKMRISNKYMKKKNYDY